MADWNRDKDGRRVGDWQRRNLRKNTNDLVETPNQKPWYQQNFVIIALLLLFWPAGLILSWKSNWHLAVKILVTVFVVAYMAVVVWFYNQGLGPA